MSAEQLEQLRKEHAKGAKFVSLTFNGKESRLYPVTDLGFFSGLEGLLTFLK